MSSWSWIWFGLWSWYFFLESIISWCSVNAGTGGTRKESCSPQSLPTFVKQLWRSLARRSVSVISIVHSCGWLNDITLKALSWQEENSHGWKVTETWRRSKRQFSNVKGVACQHGWSRFGCIIEICWCIVTFTFTFTQKLAITHGSVQHWWGGTSASMVANLNQNPNKRPICASWLPALLRQGCMYLMNINPSSATPPEERWMLDVVTQLCFHMSST